MAQAGTVRSVKRLMLNPVDRQWWFGSKQYLRRRTMFWSCFKGNAYRHTDGPNVRVREKEELRITAMILAEHVEGQSCSKLSWGRLQRHRKEGV